MKLNGRNVLAATVSLCLAGAVSSVAMAKNPPKPPPEPPPDPGAACAESESFFPAFVYGFGDEIRLSNAAGDCSILVHRLIDAEIRGIDASSIKYRLFDQGGDSWFGKVIWSEQEDYDSETGWPPTEVRLLEFEVEDQAITTPLPLEPRVLLVEPEGWENFETPDLSPDGERFVVQARFSKDEGAAAYIFEYEIPESGPVNPKDHELVVALNANELELDSVYASRPTYGVVSNGDRVYFGYGHSPRNLAYVEKNSPENWNSEAEPVLVVTREDGQGGPGDVGLWFDGREVVARLDEVDGLESIEILDVDACVAGEVGCVLVDGIEAVQVGSFTTFTEGPLPALLYLYDVDARLVGYEIRECDLMQSPETCSRTVIPGIKDRTRTLQFVDAAD